MSSLIKVILNIYNNGYLYYKIQDLMEKFENMLFTNFYVKENFNIAIVDNSLSLTYWLSKRRLEPIRPYSLFLFPKTVEYKLKEDRFSKVIDLIRNINEKYKSLFKKNRPNCLYSNFEEVESFVKFAKNLGIICSIDYINEYKKSEEEGISASTKLTIQSHLFVIKPFEEIYELTGFAGWKYIELFLGFENIEQGEVGVLITLGIEGKPLLRFIYNVRTKEVKKKKIDERYFTDKDIEKLCELIDHGFSLDILKYYPTIGRYSKINLKDALNAIYFTTRCAIIFTLCFNEFVKEIYKDVKEYYDIVKLFI